MVIVAVVPAAAVPGAPYLWIAVNLYVPITTVPPAGVGNPASGFAQTAEGELTVRLLQEVEAPSLSSAREETSEPASRWSVVSASPASTDAPAPSADERSSPLPSGIVAPAGEFEELLQPAARRSPSTASSRR